MPSTKKLRAALVLHEDLQLPCAGPGAVKAWSSARLSRLAASSSDSCSRPPDSTWSGAQGAVHGSGAEPEGGRVVEICWRSQPLWPPVDVADDGTNSPSRSKPWIYLTVPPPAAARNAVSELVDRLERGYVSAAAAANVRGRSPSAPSRTTPFPAKSEIRSGSARSSFLQQRRALLGYVLRNREVGRHQCLQVGTRRDERCEVRRRGVQPFAVRAV